MTRILLVMCCVFEVVLCYQYVGLCWGDREDVRTAEKVVYTLTALFLGVFAARQRGYFLLAYPVVLVLSGCVCAALLLHTAWKKQIGCTVVCLYFSLTALLDELCAFALLYVMEESFTVSVFFPVSGRKLLVYVFSRGCIFLLCKAPFQEALKTESGYFFPHLLNAVLCRAPSQSPAYSCEAAVPGNQID